MKTFTNIDYLTHLRWPPYHQHAGLSPKHAGRSPNLGWRRKCQRGFITIDIALAMTLSTISMVAAVYKVHTEIAQIFAKSTGQYLYTLQTGVNKYVQTHYDTLSNGEAITRIENSLEPTVAELRALKFLLPTFADTSPLGLSFATRLKPENCPGLACSITGLIYSKQTYRDQEGTLRIDLLSQARLAAGADAALSTAANGGQLVGLDNKWWQANPLGDVAGTLAARVGAVTGNLTWQLQQLYKLDGSRPLTGSMNAGGQDILHAKTMATEWMAANHAMVQKKLTTHNLQLTRLAQAGVSCDEGHGAIAIDSSGFLLTCQAGIWRSSSAQSFTGWQSLAASGCVQQNGLLLATSHFNTHMVGYTSGILRFEDYKRDKYGQGKNSALMPIMQGECFEIHGAERVWFMGM
ncbi:hypothetical protein KMZ15_03435 [Mycoavidus sp. HKI]|uniref:hypothetical protein n=1 Tax=Mycoavidus sp. HKI TaxID=2840467 RepID=UPI001CBAD5B5|nr:hypothetical protein [Mycoavidus sp. HKI]UAW64731.1 hypothetical protein KMZ15_03435 [Mycoavidus sp. HKI]